MVVRLPQVNGPHNHGFVPIFIQNAREKGMPRTSVTAAIAGPRAVVMMRRVYRLAIEKGSARQNYHAVAEEGFRLRFADAGDHHRTTLSTKLVLGFHHHAH
jgi:hypothetical protein